MSSGVWQMPICIKEHVRVHSSKSGAPNNDNIACSLHCLHLMYSEPLHYT